MLPTGVCLLQGGVETTAWIRGEEARRRAAGTWHTGPTPVVGLTGSVHPDDLARCMSGACSRARARMSQMSHSRRTAAAGMQGVLSKPYTMDQIRGAVAKYGIAAASDR